MGSSFKLKNGQDQEFSIVHNDNAGAITVASDKLVVKDSAGNISSDFKFQTSVANGATFVTAIPNGTGTFTSVAVRNNTDVSNFVFGQIANRSDSITIDSSKSGTASYVPLKLGIGGSYPLVIGTDLSVLVQTPTGLGYGTGAGGTVTQATSKSTSVTLNKPSGKITMNSAALSAGASVEFTANNSLYNANTGDTITVDAYNYGSNYRVEHRGSIGAFAIRITNITAVSLSEPVDLVFNITKGATA